MQTEPQKPDESTIAKQESEKDLVRVLCGLHTQELPLAGKPVRIAREMCRERMAIFDDAIPILEGKQVSEDCVLAAGQCLAFVDRRCEMGSRTRPRPTADRQGATDVSR